MESNEIGLTEVESRMNSDYQSLDRVLGREDKERVVNKSKLQLERQNTCWCLSHSRVTINNIVLNISK